MSYSKLLPACIITIVFTILWASVPVFSQEIKPNYDEKLIPKYTLPDVLALNDGSRVYNPETWWSFRRTEILKMLENEEYGKTPQGNISVTYKTISINRNALENKAIRKETKITFSGNKHALSMTMLVYLPKSKKPVPVFLGLNFDGNHTISNDPGITVPDPARLTENPRGSASSRWPVETIIKRGFGLATIYYEEIDPDFDDGFANGIQPLFYRQGQTMPDSGEWGSIGAWAWGLSRALDCLEKDKRIDSKKVIVIGHSRLGKAALWAGARDQRFAAVISNCSGCGGAALSKRAIGETVGIINSKFPHWFCDNFNKYNEKEYLLPFDQHMLLALIAPRPLYVASATEDLWADPKGEFLSAEYAEAVYKLMNAGGLDAMEMPSPDKPVLSKISYHIRTGKHDITLYDWQQYLNFADKFVRGN